MIDDASRYCSVYLLKTKDEVLNCFQTYKAEVENQLEKKIKRFRSDRGGEYFSNKFNLLCVEHGIIHGPKIVDCVFLGYAHYSIAYKFLVIKSKVADVHVDTFIVS
jgi:hypothetical protein